MTTPPTQAPERDFNRINTVIREQRSEEANKKWRRNPIEEYKSEQEDEITEGHLNQELRTIRRFNLFLCYVVNNRESHDIKDVRDAVQQDIEDFKNEVLLNNGNSYKTISNKLSQLVKFYNRLEANNAIKGNPASEVNSKFRDNYDLESEQPHVPRQRLNKFLNWLDTPFARSFWLIGIKNGARKGEVQNIDLRCLHIDHPVFWEVIDKHDVVLDPRIADKRDSMLIYSEFNAGDEIPNKDMDGWNTEGEIRRDGNKRKEENGSVIPIDSELKTALIEWLLFRPKTYDLNVHPLFPIGNGRARPVGETIADRLWRRENSTDSIKKFAAQESLEECPTCGNENLQERNPISTDKPGRRFKCYNCTATHFRSIYWKNSLQYSQRFTYHTARHLFSDAHSSTTQLHGNSDKNKKEIPDSVRKYRIRGDTPDEDDIEEEVYHHKHNEDFEADIREPYLDAIWKFDVYDSVIPAVGEGWESSILS